MAHLQPYASRCDGRHAEGVGPEGTPQGLSQKSSGAEEAPAETRGYNQAIPCLHRQTAQESKSQCGDTLTGLVHRPAPSAPRRECVTGYRAREGLCRAEMFYCLQTLSLEEQKAPDWHLVERVRAMVLPGLPGSRRG